MKYIIYKTQNIITGEYYFGKHRQNNPQEFDGYYGSSPTLLLEIETYGTENFVRETLGVYDCEDECYAAEERIIGDLWFSDPLCYNKQPGGKGFGSGDRHYSFGVGFTDSHKENLSKARKKRPPATLETRRKMSVSRTGTKRSAETKAKMSVSQSGKNNGFYGRTHTKAALEKISKRSMLMVGSENSSFKGYYVTPWGKYESIREAAENTPLGKDTIVKFCKQPQTIITKRMVGNSAYLEHDMIGKTAVELGFGFIKKDKQ